MKKVLFLHTTRSLPNALHLPSLVLEKTPQGFFSRTRQLVDSGETVLESVLRELGLLQEISQIVVLTSGRSDDDAIESLVHSLALELPVQCYRIPEQTAYGFKESNLGFDDAEWPYLHHPCYGAWHVDGFLELSRKFAAEVACVLQADASLLADTAHLDLALARYTVKGIYGKSKKALPAEYFVANVSFIEEIKKKYGRQAQILFDKKKDMKLFRVENYFLSHQKETNRKDFIAFWEPGERPPITALYRRQSLQDSLVLAGADLQQTVAYVCEKSFAAAFNGVSFLEIQVAKIEQNSFSLEVMRKQLDAALSHLIAVNFLFSHLPRPESISFFAGLRGKIPYVIFEFEAAALTADGLPAFQALIESADLIQLNTAESLNTDVLVQYLETVHTKADNKPLLVLQVSPRDRQKYASFRMLTDRLLIKNKNTKEYGKHEIDFSPSQRSFCKKIPTSRFWDAAGNTLICRRQAEPATSSGLQLVPADFIGQVFQAHERLSFEKMPACEDCREWYLPDIPNLYFSFLEFNPQAREKILAAIETDGTWVESAGALQMILKTLFSCQQAVRSFEAAAASRAAGFYLQFCLFFFAGIAVSIGDKLASSGEIEKALACWEELLHLEPENQEIHSRLDQALAAFAEDPPAFSRG